MIASFCLCVCVCQVENVKKESVAIEKISETNILHSNYTHSDTQKKTEQYFNWLNGTSVV